MRLYLAAAVLMLALVACTEAEGNIDQQFSRFGEQVSEATSNLAEKAKTVFESIHNSEFAVSTRSWFEEQLEKLRNKFKDTPQ